MSIDKMNSQLKSLAEAIRKELHVPIKPIHSKDIDFYKKRVSSLLAAGDRAIAHYNKSKQPQKFQQLFEIHLRHLLKQMEKIQEVVKTLKSPKKQQPKILASPSELAASVSELSEQEFEEFLNKWKASLFKPIKVLVLDRDHPGECVYLETSQEALLALTDEHATIKFGPPGDLLEVDSSVVKKALATAEGSIVLEGIPSGIAQWERIQKSIHADKIKAHTLLTQAKNASDPVQRNTLLKQSISYYAKAIREVESFIEFHPRMSAAAEKAMFKLYSLLSYPFEALQDYARAISMTKAAEVLAKKHLPDNHALLKLIAERVENLSSRISLAEIDQFMQRYQSRLM